VNINAFYWGFYRDARHGNLARTWQHGRRRRNP
jgi:hypothetical protein